MRSCIIFNSFYNRGHCISMKYYQLNLAAPVIIENWKISAFPLSLSVAKVLLSSTLNSQQWCWRGKSCNTVIVLVRYECLKLSEYVLKISIQALPVRTKKKKYCLISAAAIFHRACFGSGSIPMAVQAYGLMKQLLFQLKYKEERLIGICSWGSWGAKQLRRQWFTERLCAAWIVQPVSTVENCLVTSNGILKSYSPFNKLVKRQDEIRLPVLIQLNFFHVTNDFTLIQVEAKALLKSNYIF